MTQEANNQQTQQNQTHQPTADQQAQKVKQRRPRKTIEQELAELEARKQKLLESKRRAEAHEKIIFGATVIAMLKNMIKNKDENGEAIATLINDFAATEQMKELDIIEKIIEQTTGINPKGKHQQKDQNKGNQQGQQHHNQHQQPHQHQGQAQPQQAPNKPQ